MKFMLAMALVVSASIHLSCASNRNRTPTPTQENNPGTVLFERREQSPASRSVTAAELCPLTPGRDDFLIVGDDGQAMGRLTITREPTAEHGATIASRDDTGRTEYWRANDEGNIMLTAVLEPADHALSLFDPPIIIAAAQLDPGAAHTSRASMRVVDSSDHGRQRESGTATCTIRLQSERTIATARGNVVALAVEIEFVADLKLAHATDRTTIFVVPGRGVVAEVREEKVKILGAFSKTKRQTIVRE